MNNKTSRMLLLLTFVSLIILLLIFAGGQIKNIFGKKPAKGNGTAVLGEQTGLINSVSDPISQIHNSFQNTIQNTIEDTKEIASQKIVEVEKNILVTLEKELATLTKQQIDTVKTHICTQWGVISPFPSPTTDSD